MVDHEDHALPFGERDELFGLRYRGAHRLFDQDVFPGKNRAARKVEVRSDRRRDHDRLDALVLDNVVGRRGDATGDAHLAQHGAASFAELGDDVECEVGARGQIAKEIRSPVTESDQPDLPQTTLPFEYATAARLRSRTAKANPARAGRDGWSAF